MFWEGQLSTPTASQVGLSFKMSDGEEDEAGVADADILRDSHKDDNVAAVEAPEARLASGSATGRAAAAAWAGEMALAAAAGSQA